MDVADQQPADLPKLVRDKVPGEIEASGRVPRVRSMTRVEFGDAARRKLAEEAQEVADAQTRDELVSELADLAEIGAALMELHEITAADVDEARAHRRAERGAFRERLLLEAVSAGKPAC